MAMSMAMNKEELLQKEEEDAIDPSSMAMTMAMDEEELLQEEQDDLWCLQLQRGERMTLIPYDDEPFVVTDVFLVDPKSAGGQGVVSAWVKIGTRDIMLAQLSSEVTDVELETPVVLDEEFCFYVMRPDTNSDADTDEDAIVVQFEGYVHSPADEESEEDDQAASSEEDDDGTEEESEEDEASDGEVDGDVAMGKQRQGVVAAFFRLILVFSCVLCMIVVFFRLLM